MLKRVLFASVLIALPLFAVAYTSPGKPVGFVNDFAGMLSPETKIVLETELKDFSDTTGNQIVIATVPTHGVDETIETYAVKLFEEWGVGKAKEDSGLLLLVARDDREMRIEVGYGLEPVVTDIESGRIIREVLMPAFQAEEYDAGIGAATERILDDIGRGAPPPEPVRTFPWGDVIYAVIILIIVIVNIRRKKQGKGMLFPIFIDRGGRGGRGGGFGGFGGGSSGGGGASGRW